MDLQQNFKHRKKNFGVRINWHVYLLRLLQQTLFRQNPNGYGQKSVNLKRLAVLKGCCVSRNYIRYVKKRRVQTCQNVLVAVLQLL